MLDDKRKPVIQLIQKLLSFGVPDDEILKNLYDVGLNEEEAKALITEAKSPGTKKKEEQVGSEKNSKDVFDDTTNKLSLDDQITNQLNLKESKEEVTKKPEEKNINPSEVDFGLKVKSFTSPETKKTQVPLQQKKDDLQKAPINKIISEETKIVSQEKKQTQNPQKMTSQKNPSPFISEELQKSLDEITGKNISGKSPQFKKDVEEKNVPKKQEKTMPSEVDDFWKKGIIVAVNTKLAEMKKLKEDVDSLIGSRVDTAMKKEIEQLKVLLESQKELIVSTNKDALEQKQKEITFIIDSKIAEIKQNNQELNKTLEQINSAKNIQGEALKEIEGALSEAKKTKSQLIVEMNSELIKSKSGAQAFLDKAQEQLDALDERINKTLELEKNIAEGLMQEAEQKIESLTITKADDLIEEMEVKLNNLKTIEKNIDPEAIEQKIKMLDEFKKQFLTNMIESLEKINSAIERLNEKNAVVEKTLEEKTLAIDAKVEELTNFEKRFTSAIHSLVNESKNIPSVKEEKKIDKKDSVKKISNSKNISNKAKKK